jgi:DNA polymerase III psi subunit
MNSISENSKCIRNLKESELAATLKMNLSHHIFLIGDTKSMELNNLGINFKSSPSIEEMLGNTDKKKKLWHDIQSLLRDEMKEKF